MPPVTKDKEHLFRMAGLFLAGIVAFLLLRVALVPKDFGVTGHYRFGALADARAKPLVYAGAAACADCHADVMKKRKGSRHEQISCETCHGPQLKHATVDPGANKPAKLDERALCLRCHTANVAKPKGFKQVDPKDHGDGGVCTTCHAPHTPEKGPA
jgi:hypothetical protein